MNIMPRKAAEFSPHRRRAADFSSISETLSRNLQKFAAENWLPKWSIIIVVGVGVAEFGQIITFANRLCLIYELIALIHEIFLRETAYVNVVSQRPFLWSDDG